MTIPKANPNIYPTWTIDPKFLQTIEDEISNSDKYYNSICWEEIENVILALINTGHLKLEGD